MAKQRLREREGREGGRKRGTKGRDSSAVNLENQTRRQKEF